VAERDRGHGEERHTDLSGFWTGAYWYGGGGGETPFNAYLADRSGELSGTTLERPLGFGAGVPDEISGVIDGVRDEFLVRFRKRYDQAPGVHGYTILYAGQADAAFCNIAGQWTFPLLNGGTGGFWMRRLRAAGSTAREDARELAGVHRVADRHAPRR
jgi:hypothetical protein